MKKLLLSFSILFCLQLTTLKAQWVTIPDPAFVIQLTQQFPSCMNGNQLDTSCVEILNTTELNLMAGNLTNLSGIKHFVNLLTLNCNYNALTSLPALPNNLVNLNCSHNQLTNISSLPNTLKTFNCVDNQLTSLPTVPYIMTEFQIGYNNISCLNNLPESPPFGYIVASLAGNPLTCVPNQTSYTYGLPECLMNDPINNPNNCPSVFHISGKVFTDEDNNCLFNAGDSGISNISLKLYDSSNNLIAQNFSMNGSYNFIVNQLGTYQIKIEDNLYPIALVCGFSNTQTVSVTSQAIAITDINFPVVCDLINDIYIQSVSSNGIVFPGQQHTLQTNITNTETWFNLDCDTSTFSGTVSILITGPVAYVSPGQGALIPQVLGNTYTYNIGNFNNLNANSFNLMLITDTTAQGGNQICAHVVISTSPLDNDTANNSFNYCYTVINSYDPNMKEVYPLDVIPGYEDWFTYTIHFQNTGNAPALNIRLRDTLDNNLDINSFEVANYSHPANTTLNGNILTIKFNNIMLADSTTNYEGSMGYFQYRIKPIANLPSSTQIKNRAYIYFDYNSSILTNTTLNKFDLFENTINISYDDQHYVLYPNPSTGIFMFRENRNIKLVEVFNIMGELVLSQGNAKIINLQGFPKGIYVARINGSQVCRLVKE